ncbi:MAG: phosphoribosylformylglycinamidine synthase I [Planctomycetes bacterium]|nr:phosphoribosylformylglycinamidine synthase I [Planctomycetota bacterium]
MATVSVIVLRAAGINCDQETVHAWRLAGADVELVHVNTLIGRLSLLDDAQVLTIPGGFSYGDDIAAGKILAQRIKGPLRDAMQQFVDAGKLVLGICNGFQVLLKCGLLPGSGMSDATVTLTANRSGRYEDRWVHLETPTDRCPLLAKGERLFLPLAHAEGRVVADGTASQEALKQLDRVALRFVYASGAPAEGASAYPANPNGSKDGVAALTDESGRILGLMPHPERYVDATQHPTWTRIESPDTPDGLRLFQRGVACFR